MTEALPDFERQNAVNHWRNALDDIDRMLRELPEQHVTITSYAMDLAGPAASTEPPLPGGDALDILGPWSSDATFGDDPTPRQVIVEWAQTVYDAHGQVPPAGLRYTQALVYVREQVPWILESPWVEAWTTDIAAVRGRLAALCPPEVDEHHDDTPPPTEIDLSTMGHLIPAGTVLTRDEIERFWPDELNGTQWAALRKRAQRAREAGERIPARKYLVDWVHDTLSISLRER